MINDPSARPSAPTPSTIEQLERRVLLSGDGLPMTFGGRVRAFYTDADGDAVLVTLKGPGTGTITFPGAGNTDATRIELDGTTSASVLSVTGDTNVGELEVPGIIKSITGKGLDLTTSLRVSGGLSALRLDDVFNTQLQIGQSGPLSVVIDQAVDSSLVMRGPLKSIRIGTWSDFDPAPDLITAWTVGSLTSKGDFGADIVADSVGKVSVKGAIVGSEIRAAGSIASVVAASINQSVIFAGILPGLPTLPAAATELADREASIGRLTLRSTAPRAFVDSMVAAATIRRANVGAIVTANGLRTHGVAADRMGSFAGSTSARGAFATPAREDPGDVVLEEDFVLRVL